MADDFTNLANTPFAPSSWLVRTLHWLKAREFWVLLLAAGFQLLVLGGMIVHRAKPLVAGETILLRVVPADLRDLFRGDYVILSYDFSHTAPGTITGLGASGYNAEAWQGRTVYVSLVPEADGRHWRTSQVTATPPRGGKYLRGTITRWGCIECGIEAYYLQEGTGTQYEQAIRNHHLSAEVAVTADGQATLRALKIEP